MKYFGQLLTAVVLYSGAAEAAPVYLDCQITNGAKDVTWNVSLDEAAQTVSYAIPDMDVTEKLPATFLPNKVIFGAMEIDRTNLQLTRKSGLGRVDTGNCKLSDAPKRAF